QPARAGRELTRLMVATFLSIAVGGASIPAFGASWVSSGTHRVLSASAATRTTCLPSATKVGQGTTTLPSTQHCTILEIGDSLGTDLGEGLHLQLEKNPSI